MFGITPLGWVHTLGSLPAIPLAAFMLVKFGRIEPRSSAGRLYLVFMLIGALSAFAVAKTMAGLGIATLTPIALAVGYGVSQIRTPGRAGQYIETIALSASVLLLMVPTVTETLTRVPDGNPWAKSIESPLVLGAQGALLVLFLIGVTLQLLKLRRGRLVV